MLKQHEAGCKVPDLAREIGVATIYTWQSKYGCLEVNEAQRRRGPEDENWRLKHLVADLTLRRRRTYLSVARALWDSIGPEVKTPARPAVFQSALESLDRADQARVSIEVEGLVKITARSGVSHIHPAIKIEHESRRQLARLFEMLSFSDAIVNPFEPSNP